MDTVLFGKAVFWTWARHKRPIERRAMTRETNPLSGQRAWEVLIGEGEVVGSADRWAHLIVRYWGFLFVVFVFLIIWLPNSATSVGLQVGLWIIAYFVYLVSLEILCRRPEPLRETRLFQLFRIHLNLAMITILGLVTLPTTSSYLWFFFAMPLLATVVYSGASLWPLIVYAEVFLVMLVLTIAQGWLILPNIAAMGAKDAILGLLTVILYFFVHLSPKIREESTLVKAATTLLKTFDQSELCQLLADTARAGVPAAEAAVVHLLEGKRDPVLIPKGSSHLDITALGKSPMKIGVGIAGHAIQSREMINVPDVSKDSRYHQLPLSFMPFKSLLVAPMYVGDKNVGTISVHSASKGAFGKRDERFLTTLAAQGATAIANAELYSVRTWRRRQMSDILEASRSFSLNQPLDALLETIAAEVRRCSAYQIAVVNLVDEASGEIVVRGMAGVPPDIRRKLEGMRIPHSTIKPLFQQEFLVSQSYFIRHDRSPKIPDLDQYTITPDLGERKPGEWHSEDMLIIPIQTPQNELVGYISVDDPRDRQLPSLDTIRALELLASVAATAIQNARLYESLAREQQLLQTFMDSIPDHIYFKNIESGFIRINRAMANWFGLDDPMQAMGKTDSDFFTEEHAQLAYEDEQEIIRTGQPLSKEEKEWVLTTKMPLRDKEGKIIGTLGISKDVTDRKRITEALVSTLELDQVIAIVLEEVRRLLGVTAASVWLTEQETPGLVCRQVTGLHSEAVRDWHLPPGKGIASWVARHGESQIVPDTRADERHYKVLDQLLGWELRSILSVPLRFKQDVIGVLEVVDTEVDRFKPTDLALVESLAATAAIAIANARLYKETNRLRAFNENIVQSMEEGILLYDANGHITFVNHRMSELLGCAPEELMGQHWKAIAAPEELTKIEEETAKRPRGIANRYETILLTKKDQRVPVIVSATPRFDVGSFTGVLAVFTDITDRKQQETRLQEYLSTVTNSLAYHTTLDGLYKFIVEAGARFLSARDCSLFLTDETDNNTLELVATTALLSGTGRPHIAIDTKPGCGLVARVVATRQPIRLEGEEILRHPFWNKDFWTGLGWSFDPEINHSFLAAPMCLPDGSIMGVLAARDATSRRGFSEFDEVLLKTLATNAAADIERVRGLEKAREGTRRAERKRLEADLHEAMNVLAIGVRWEAEILAEEMERVNLDAARIALERLQAARTRAYTDLNYLLEDLRDPILEQEGLLSALKKRAELIGRGRIVVHGDSWERLSQEIEATLYRVGQEVISNAVKHSGFVDNPDVKVEVWLERNNGQVRFFVKDDGAGFDVESTLALPHKWGLRRLRDILHEIGGELSIDSAPGKGVTICATINLTKGMNNE
jgi:PAS domain S-box-containing protein